MSLLSFQGSRSGHFKPDYAEPYNNLGVALARPGRLDEAIDHFKQALRLKPTYLEARANLGIALEEAGKSSNEADRSSRLELPENKLEQTENVCE